VRQTSKLEAALCEARASIVLNSYGLLVPETPVYMKLLACWAKVVLIEVAFLAIYVGLAIKFG
jgi:hypothetical protein